MVWTRLDDQFPDDPKIAPLSDAAFRMYVCSIVYSNRLLTDGEIPKVVAHRYVARRGHHIGLELVKAGLFHETGDRYVVHDFHDRNPSASEVIERREARARAGRKGGQSKRLSNSEANTQANSKQNRTPVPYPEPEPSSQGDDQHPSPQVSTSPSVDVVAARLATTCGRISANDAFAFVAAAAEHVDLGLIDELVGYVGALTIDKRPRTIAYLTKTLRSWASQRGIDVPELEVRV